MVKAIVYRGDGRAYLRGRDGSMTTWARVVARNTLGCDLVKGEEVHHVDGDWTNDAPSNLEVMTRREHAQRHPDKMSWRGSRWSSGLCAGCGCEFDDRQRGCATCSFRHSARRRKKRVGA